MWLKNDNFLKNFISALILEAVGGAFIFLGVQGMDVPSDYWWLSLIRVSIFNYMCLGIGLIFFISAGFLVRNAFVPITEEVAA